MNPYIERVLEFHQAYPELRLDLLLALVLAAILGGSIGWERQRAGKPAGLRTNVLICVGAALLTDTSLRMAGLGPTGDAARISAQIVSGVGFLGAGTIIQARGTVTGLTSAATLWVVAAIGMAVGSGGHVEAVGTTVLVLIVLIPLHVVESNMERKRAEKRKRAAEAAAEVAGDTGDTDGGSEG